jgi:hypothetical protein
MVLVSPEIIPFSSCLKKKTPLIELASGFSLFIIVCQTHFPGISENLEDED